MKAITVPLQFRMPLLGFPVEHGALAWQTGVTCGLWWQSRWRSAAAVSSPDLEGPGSACLWVTSLIWPLGTRVGTRVRGVARTCRKAGSVLPSGDRDGHCLLLHQVTDAGSPTSTLRHVTGMLERGERRQIPCAGAERPWGGAWAGNLLRGSSSRQGHGPKKDAHLKPRELL